MIPYFLDGQPMHHYTVIENSKLFQHLLPQPSKVINLAIRCHNFHLWHLLWNKCVIQAANALYMTERWEGNRAAREWGPLALRPHKQHFLFVAPLVQSLKCAIIIEPNGANENALRQIKRRPQTPLNQNLLPQTHTRKIQTSSVRYSAFKALPHSLLKWFCDEKRIAKWQEEMGNTNVWCVDRH